MRLLLASSALLLAASCAPSSESVAAERAAQTARALPEAICADHPGSAFALTKVAVEATATGGFDVTVERWLDGVPGQDPNEPPQISRYTLARGMTCWAGDELAAHLRPVRRYRQPDAGTVLVPKTYCESADGSAQLLLQEETHRSTWDGATVTEAVALFDSPELPQILPWAMRTAIDTFIATFMQRITGGPGGDRVFDDCSF